MDTGFFDNKKIKAIRNMPSGSDILVIWIELLVLAGQINDSGSIYFNHEVPYTADLLASQFGFPISTIQLALTTFVKFEMIDIIDDIIMISNWQKYQNEEALARIRALANARQQRHRQKIKEQKLLESGESNVDGNVVSNVTCHEKCSYISISNKSSSLYKEDNEDREKGCGEKGKKGKEEDVVGLMFCSFYESYGNKKGRKAAEKAFRKINPDEALFKKMLEGVEKYHQSREWREGYRKHPSTWLNEECWNDEYDDDIPIASKQKRDTSARNAAKFDYGTEDDYDEYGYPVRK